MAATRHTAKPVPWPLARPTGVLAGSSLNRPVAHFVSSQSTHRTACPRLFSSTSSKPRLALPSGHALTLSQSAVSRRQYATPSTAPIAPDVDPPPEDPHWELAFSRRDLMRWWHKRARDVSLGDVKWEGRNHLQSPCTVIHADGTVEKTDPLSKQEMIDEFGIQPRDLRSLDAHVLDVRPCLLVCKKSIILCTPIVRAIIAHDRLLIVGADPSNPLITEEQAEHMRESLMSVMRYLDTVAATGESSENGSKRYFEFRALEALLLITVRGFKLVATELQSRVYDIIPQLRFGVSPSELRHLLESKRIVEDCLFSGRAMQSALSTVLSEDEDLVGMYLTDKAKGVVRHIEDHQNAELLLEYYERRLDETNESSVRLASLLSDLDSNISLTLASTRVRLQNLELQTAISTLALGAGTALAGFFGMNLVSGFEESPVAFYYAVGAGVGSMGIIMIIGWIRLLRARRSQLFLGSPMREHHHLVNRLDKAAKETPRVGSSDASGSTAVTSTSTTTKMKEKVTEKLKSGSVTESKEQKKVVQLEQKREAEAKKDGSEI